MNIFTRALLDKTAKEPTVSLTRVLALFIGAVGAIGVLALLLGRAPEAVPWWAWIATCAVAAGLKGLDSWKTIKIAGAEIERGKP